MHSGSGRETGFVFEKAAHSVECAMKYKMPHPKRGT